jgi:ABC-type multidrug transport system fused ATPase/permease subunit
VDGIDLNELDMVSWREHIGVVDQEAFLLNTSVCENISFARLDISQDKIVAVAHAANADEFIRHLDLGYDTVLGDRGLRLSGGQQQRVVLARALLRNPEILVLDEATSALDTESEKIIQDTLEEMHSERTILVIAHRLSTVIGADNIIVIDGGKIIEQGSAEKLLQQTGKFAELWSYQQTPK